MNDQLAKANGARYTVDATAAGAHSSMQASMLRMASAAQGMGQVNQAIDLYAQIIRRFPASAEAEKASARLEVLANDFERQGRYRLALSVYAKLEQGS